MNPFQKYTTEQLVRIRNAMSVLLTEKFFGNEDGHDAALRIQINIQRELLNRKVSLASLNFRICEDCCMEIDLREKNWTESKKTGGYIHLFCPELKENRP